ncbi:nudix hydrolase-like protein [Mactra antiquata]
MSATELPRCQFVKEEDTATGKWLKLSKITYTDPAGKERLWEAVKRTTRLPGNTADAVVSIPILRRTLYYDCFVLVKQYRPPIKAYSLEFPAGLLDPKETPETCALRELKEETGYTGIAKHTSPATSLEPGVGDMSAHFVTVEIDGDLPENIKPKMESGCH